MAVYVVVMIVTLILTSTYKPFQKTLLHLIGGASDWNYDVWMNMDTNTLQQINIQHYNNSGNRTLNWLNTYNQTKLRTYLKTTLEAYVSRPDRAPDMLSRESFIDVQNSTILFEGQFTDPKLGPCVSLYWQSRMFSFFSTFYKFQFRYQWDGNGQVPSRQRIWSDPRQYFSFLPKYSDIHAIDIDPDTYSKYADWVLHWMLYTIQRGHKYIGLFIYTSDHLDLMFSKLFVEIMRYETNIAFNAYFKFNNLTRQQNWIRNEMWVSKTDDVVIHIRCQDVLLNPISIYGMSSLHYFNDAIRNVLNITLHQNMAIHIILYLSGGMAGRASIPEDTNACTQYLYEFVQPSFVKTFAPAQIKIIRNGSITSDFYRFVSAPNMICGASSYCLMGAVANHNNVVLYQGWTAPEWYQNGWNDSFGTIADNIHFLEDPYFSGDHFGWNVTDIANLTMVIDGKYVL